MQINYDDIEQATSKEFVRLIQRQLGSKKVWKHFEIDETENFYCIDAINCHIGDRNCTYCIYHFQFNKSSKEFFDQRFGTHYIERMIKKGWLNETVSP